MVQKSYTIFIYFGHKLYLYYINYVCIYSQTHRHLINKYIFIMNFYAKPWRFNQKNLSIQQMYSILFIILQYILSF